MNKICLLCAPSVVLICFPFWVRSRLRVVPLSLIPSYVTRKKIVRKKWPRGILGATSKLLAPMISRDHFFLAVFVRVTHDGRSERGTTRSLGSKAIIFRNLEICGFRKTIQQVRPVTRKGYESIANEAKRNGLLTRGP